MFNGNDTSIILAKVWPLQTLHLLGMNKTESSRDILFLRIMWPRLTAETHGMTVLNTKRVGAVDVGLIHH